MSYATKCFEILGKHFHLIQTNVGTVICLNNAADLDQIIQ